MISLKNSKSQSQVITAILLILIAMTLIVIISGFAISFVKDKLGEKSCVDVIGKVEFTDNTKYTCYDINGPTMRVQVHIGDLTEEIIGFTISTEIAGSSDNFEIKNGTNYVDAPKVIMYRPITGYETKILIPPRNSEKTYNITVSGEPDNLKIYPILADGTSCDSSDTLITITHCK